MVTVTSYVVMRIVHLMTAGVWAGWTVFMAALVVPAARDGRLGSDALSWLTGRFSLLSKVAPVVMFLTGMYMFGQGYSSDTLLASTRGILVLTMIGLWIALSALTNVSSRRLAGNVEAVGVQRAAGNARGLFTAASIVALALLLVGGWLQGASRGYTLAVAQVADETLDRIAVIRAFAPAKVFERTLVSLRSVEADDDVKFETGRRPAVRPDESPRFDERRTKMSTRGKSPVDRVVETVSSWPGITTGEGRFDSTRFRVAGREIGYVHRQGPVDIGYPTPLRDRLIAEGRTGEHHVVPNSNATTFYVETMDDVERAVALLRISYLYHVSVLRRTPAGEEGTEDVDVEAELDELELSDELRAVVSQALHSG